ncbi:MAG TPA: hypothetical protein VGX48_23050 [Pyrinomonadaceae bacterium]|nr:hypothetical protein [Pyrinomonadaceae bacterium]
MPKPLDKPQPTSSVANMLDLGVGAAALAKPPRRENVPPTPVANEIPPQPVPTEPPGEPANIHRQFILTRSADDTLKKLVRIYSRAGGVDLKSSEVMRAVLVALEHAAPELEREAARIGRLKRPKNDRGNEGLRDRLERRIARAIITGLKATTPPEEEIDARLSGR